MLSTQCANPLLLSNTPLTNYLIGRVPQGMCLYFPSNLHLRTIQNPKLCKYLDRPTDPEERDDWGILESAEERSLGYKRAAADTGRV